MKERMLEAVFSITRLLHNPRWPRGTLVRMPERDGCTAANRRGVAPLTGAVCLAASLLVLTAGCETTKPVTYPGKLVRKELVRTERTPGFTCELADSFDGTLRIQVTGYDIVVYHEIPVYEKVLEYRAPDETDRGTIDQKVVVDEFVRGKMQKRVEKVPAGPVREESFKVNGTVSRTDARGLIEAPNDTVLSMFDNLAVSDSVVRITHSVLGEVQMKVTRSELMNAIGVEAEEPGKTASPEAIDFAITAPKKIARGQPFVITLSGSNHSALPSSCIEARIVSRIPWLDGRMFYLGVLKPGNKRTFSRRFTAPKTQPDATVYATVGPWAPAWGPVHTANLTIRLRITSE